MRWTRSVTLEDLRALNHQTADEHCGIRFTAIGDDWLEATVPLDSRTRATAGR
jgi:1,4-dihydroxy-2-naphthoyl-CoA hydrolase